MDKLVITIEGGVVQNITSNFDTDNFWIIINDLDNIEEGESPVIFPTDYDSDTVEEIATSIQY